MSNTNVPGKPVLVRFDGDEALVEWSTAARSGYTWNVYASLSGVPPLAGPPVASGLLKQQSNVYAPSVPGNSPPVNDFYVAVTSVNNTTGQESAQGQPLLVSASAPSGGSDSADAVLSAVDPSGKFSAVRVGPTGSLIVDASFGPPPIGASTEAKQDTQITQLTGVQTRQDNQLSQLNDIESKQDTQVTQLTGVQARQDSQLSQLNDIESKQDTQITHLASIDTKTPEQGQATMAGSTPVVVASNQSSIPVNLATGLDRKPILQSQSVVFARECVDPSERARVSSPNLVFGDNIELVKNAFAWGELTASGGAVTMVAAEGAVDLTTTTASGSRAVYQTKRHFRPAHSHAYRVLLQFLFGAALTNNTKRLGYFTSAEGIFLEQAGAATRLVTRSSVSGSPVDTPVEQGSWNIDKLDGSGASAVTLNFSNIQAMAIDLHPPSQAIVGFYDAGRFYQAHRFVFPNVSATPSFASRVLPLAAENVNTAGTASPGSLKIYSAAVSSEGEHFVNTYPFSADSGTTGLNVGSGTTSPLLSIRPRTGFPGARALLSHISFINTNGADFRIRVVLNGALTGATFATSTGLATEVDTAATVITGGTVVYTLYVTSGNTGSAVETDVEDLDIRLATAVDGTRDVISVVVTAITNTNGTRTALNWKEAV